MNSLHDDDRNGVIHEYQVSKQYGAYGCDDGVIPMEIRLGRTCAFDRCEVADC